MKKLSVLMFILLSFTNLLHAEINLVELEAKLKGDGVKGEIHGAVNDAKLYVFTYRNPNNFFENVQLPLTSESPEVLATLLQLKRHQMYVVKGEFITNKAPIKHINATSLTMAQDYSSELDHMPYSYKGDVNDLKNKTEFTGRVHAIGEQGKMLVMEYKDRIVPVFVTDAASQSLTSALYRGDLVKLKIRVRAEPEAPTHLSLANPTNLPAGEKTVELLESLVKSHGSSITKTGNLIKFPKSPQINSNIYALLVEDPEGTTIQYTLTNFDSPELFKQILEKCEKVWNDNSVNAENDRNKLVNKKLIVHAKGLSNMVDAGQANPQILIQSIDDLTFEVVK